MTELFADPILAFAALVVLLLLLALVWATSRRPYVREVERLREDLHGLLASGERAERIAVNGRLSPFVDISASMNRLLDRSDEAARAELAAVPPPPPPPPSDDRNPLFDALAVTLPEVALIHTSTILYANRAAGELFGVDSETLVGKPITDVLRPAYRALMRKHVGAGADEPLVPFEVQLISNDDQGLWAELHSKRITFGGEPALLTVARDITHRKSLETSLGRGKLQARITLESIGEGVITTDRNGTIDYMNEAAEQLIGATRSAGIGKRLLDLLSLVD
ncbi:MAG TPA: PAS domain S-box protein, partial [Gammaproteobacteria bacterium]|nr:PAS domain S-box protein [Gammaproteobacteria bacterium]